MDCRLDKGRDCILYGLSAEWTKEDTVFYMDFDMGRCCTYELQRPGLGLRSPISYPRNQTASRRQSKKL